MSPADQPPPQVRPGTTFRVFVSSTFRDFVAERNALQEKVWPELSALCERNGARFQAVDLRWGVSEEAGRDQRTMDICLEEIRRCQQVTPRPNFIVLLGDRYGWRPLPSRIPCDEFEAIEAHTADPDDLARIQHWYLPDENAVPAEYVLRGREGEFEGHDIWSAEESRLHGALLTGARGAGIWGDALTKYERSATEQEIVAGALRAGEDHAFCYHRCIEGLPGDQTAADFIDLDQKGRRDAKAVERLEHLKGRLSSHLVAGHVHRIVTRWDDGGLSPEHIDALCERVRGDLSRTILEELEKLEAVDGLDHEIQAHADFAAERARHFVGRHQIIRRINDYVAGDERYPLVIHGRSGSGKSALMAKVLERLPPDAPVISRFIGATPASTELTSLLRGLCRQIHREFGLAALQEQWRPPKPKPGAEEEEAPQNPYEVPGAPEELIGAFERFLTFVPEGITLVIVLDALDQLGRSGNAHSLDWLPRELPAGVRVVASTLEREDPAGQCHRSAQARLPGDALIGLSELSLNDGGLIIDTWLAQAGRSLQPEQRDDLLSALDACHEGRALFLGLALGEACRWRAFDGLPTGANDVPGLSRSVAGVIEDMLARLEAPENHGPLLVRRALSYLAAARNGLTEGELLGILTADDAVWGWVRDNAHHELPERALPAIIWSRLYFDVRPYLADRAADGTSVLSFYHRQVAENVQRRYMSDEADRVETHNMLGSYFADREPWLDENARVADLRRASELAWQQTRAQDWQGLEATLTDLQSLEAKTEGGGVFDLMADFASAVAALPTARSYARPLRLLREALGVDAQFISRHPTTVFQCLWNRAWWYDCDEAAAQYDESEGDWGAHGAPWERPEPRLSTLLERWRSEKEGQQSGFIWARSLRPPPFPLGSGQIVCLQGHEAEVMGLAFSRDGRRVASGGRDGTTRVWDLDTGELIACFYGDTGQTEHVALSPDGRRVVSWAWDGAIWDVESGQRLSRLPMPDDWHAITGLAISPDGHRIVTTSYSDLLRVWDASTGEEVACLGTPGANGYLCLAFAPDGGRIVLGGWDGTVRVWHTETHQELMCLSGHEHPVQNVAISQDGCRIASIDHLEARIWDALNGEELKRIDNLDAPHSRVVFEPSGRCVAVLAGFWSRTSSAYFDRNVMRYRDLDTGEELARLYGHDADITSSAVSPDGCRIASGALDNTVRVWDVADLEPSPRPQTQRGHSMTFSLDGSLMAVAASGETVSSDGSLMAVEALDETVALFSTRRGHEILRLCGHRSQVGGVSISPDGKRLVSADADVDQSSWRLWDVATGDELASVPRFRSSFTCLAFDPSGRLVVSGSGMWDNAVRVWDAETGRQLASLEGDGGSIAGVAFSPDGRRIAWASEDRTVSVWDTTGGGEISRLKWRGGMARGVAFSADGTRIISKLSDHTAQIWDAESLKCMEIVEAWEDATAVASGLERYAFRVCDRGLETAIESTAGDGELLWLPQGTDEAVRHPAGRIWAAATPPGGGDYFIFCTLEGYIGARRGVGIVTATRVWCFEQQTAGTGLRKRVKHALGGVSAWPGRLVRPTRAGHWDDELTVLCCWCGHRFAVDETAVGEKLDCPNCRGALKLNEFVCDMSRTKFTQLRRAARRARRCPPPSAPNQ